MSDDLDWFSSFFENDYLANNFSGSQQQSSQQSNAQSQLSQYMQQSLCIPHFQSELQKNSIFVIHEDSQENMGNPTSALVSQVKCNSDQFIAAANVLPFSYTQNENKKEVQRDFQSYNMNHHSNTNLEVSRISIFERTTSNFPTNNIQQLIDQSEDQNKRSQHLNAQNQQPFQLNNDKDQQRKSLESNQSFQAQAIKLISQSAQNIPQDPIDNPSQNLLPNDQPIQIKDIFEEKLQVVLPKQTGIIRRQLCKEAIRETLIGTEQENELIQGKNIQQKQYYGSNKESSISISDDQKLDAVLTHLGDSIGQISNENRRQVHVAQKSSRISLDLSFKSYTSSTQIVEQKTRFQASINTNSPMNNIDSINTKTGQCQGNLLIKQNCIDSAQIQIMKEGDKANLNVCMKSNQNQHLTTKFFSNIDQHDLKLEKVEKDHDDNSRISVWSGMQASKPLNVSRISWEQKPLPFTNQTNMLETGNSIQVEKSSFFQPTTLSSNSHDLTPIYKIKYKNEEAQLKENNWLVQFSRSGITKKLVESIQNENSQILSTQSYADGQIINSIIPKQFEQKCEDIKEKKINVSRQLPQKLLQFPLFSVNISTNLNKSSNCDSTQGSNRNRGSQLQQKLQNFSQNDTFISKTQEQVNRTHSSSCSNITPSGYQGSLQREQTIESFRGTSKQLFVEGLYIIPQYQGYINLLLGVIRKEVEIQKEQNVSIDFLKKKLQLDSAWFESIQVRLDTFLGNRYFNFIQT